MEPLARRTEGIRDHNRASRPATGPAYREVEVDLEVRRREVSADGVVTLTLADPDRRRLAEVDARRAHRPCDDTVTGAPVFPGAAKRPNRSEWRIGVLLDPNSRGGSQFVHDKLHQGTAIRVRGPRNHFPLVSSPRYQFVAGGIGITPMLPMIEAAEAHRR